MRDIPSIDHLLQRPAIRALVVTHGRSPVVAALRAAAEALRTRLSAGEPRPGDPGAWLEAEIPRMLQSMFAPSLRPVINATGVILHTNLGRAPLAASALQRIAELGGYSNLEFDLARGERGRRDAHAEKLLCQLTGAAAAVVVNNNAAAALVTLAALAAGREVIISRGELVEIGGGFRVPDVLAQSGAILREVGTTNRTRLSDYSAAISEKTAAVLRVHASNFRIVGFTERPPMPDLGALVRRFNLLLIDDVGSGWLGSVPPPAVLKDEPGPRASLADGADVVLFSGDKLLGGPQAGIIAGKESAISAVRRHPLMRALRVDKITYAALEATLQDYAAGRADQDVPVARMIRMTAAEVAARAAAIIERLGRRLTAELVDGVSTIGGGSAPGSMLATRLIAVSHPAMSARQLQGLLRGSDPPVIARIEQDRVVVDLRTVAPEQDAAIVNALLASAPD